MPHIIELTLRVLLGAGLLILALTPILRPRPFVTRDWAALGAALLIGAELLLGFWLYTYIVWFFPLLLIVLVGTQPPPDQTGSQEWVDRRAAVTEVCTELRACTARRRLLAAGFAGSQAAGCAVPLTVPGVA